MKNSTFTQKYNSIQNVIPFNPEWANGTGYYDGAVRADLGLEPGQLAKSFSGGENRRRMIFVGTRFGNHVVFDRYSNQDSKEDDANVIVVANSPNALNGLVSGTCLSDSDFAFEVGEYWTSSNIGTVLENLFAQEARYAAKNTLLQILKSCNAPIKTESEDMMEVLSVAQEQTKYEKPAQRHLVDGADNVYLYVKGSDHREALFKLDGRNNVRGLENPLLEMGDRSRMPLLDAKELVELYNDVYKGTFPATVVNH